jgi:single-strand DNA-binding protein
MNYKMIGVVKKIGEKVQITEKFAKKEINIETNSKYPEVLQFEFINDKCSLIETVDVNDAVEISFDIRGREWEGKILYSIARI